jgi:hypothetical protein
MLVSIGANITFLTALLVFFGWKRAEAHAETIGISESMLGLSPQDYLLRSVDSLFPLLAAVSLPGLGWLWVNSVFTRLLRERHRLQLIGRLTQLMVFAWFLLPGLCALVSWQFSNVGYLAFPLSLAAGILLTYYGVYLRSKLRAIHSNGFPTALPAWHSTLIKTFVAMLVTLCLFWEASNYATVLGENLGRGLVAELPYLTKVLVYSPNRLEITAPEVREEHLQGEAAYRYRYSGLRLLEHTDRKYFMVSDGWTPRYGVVVVISETDTVRLEFVRDLRSPTPSSKP